MFPSLIEFLLYLAYAIACATVVFFYGPYVIYLMLGRKSQFKVHRLRLCACVFVLLGLLVWQQTRPSDTYMILEAINPSQKGSVVFLHEAAFQDSQTHLCVRDYSRSGQKLIHIGIVEGEGVRSEIESWAVDGSNVIVEMGDKPDLGYDFNQHKILRPAEIRLLLTRQRATRKPVRWDGAYGPISYWKLRGFKP